jgi:hypothetical protein
LKFLDTGGVTAPVAGAASPYTGATAAPVTEAAFTLAMDTLRALGLAAAPVAFQHGILEEWQARPVLAQEKKA